MDVSGLFVFQIFVVLFSGLALGSFATAVTHRTLNGQSWIMGEGRAARSCCPSCQKELSLIDLVPVFSWLCLRGKCRQCGQPVSPRYVLIELLCALLCLGVFLSWGFSVSTFIIMAMIPFLVALVFVDLDKMILPNDLVAICGAIGAVFAGWQLYEAGFSDMAVNATLSRVAAFVLFPFVIWGLGKIVKAVLKKEALGFGDVKFFAVCGLWSGVFALPFLMIFSGLFGIITGFLWRLKSKSGPFPFGPELIAAFYFHIILAGPLFTGVFGKY